MTTPDYRDINDPDVDVVCAGCYRAPENCVCPDDNVCPDCYGIGTDWKGGRCPHCGGSGVVS